jgi:antitoxin component YwqK of YwqJK toxin-antitoxin module
MLSKDTIRNTLILSLSGVAEYKNSKEIWVQIGCVKNHTTIEIIDSAAGKLIVRTYYCTGKMRYRAEYKNYKRNGSYREWDKNGQLWVTGRYINGKRDGIFKNHIKNYQVTYKMGKADVPWNYCSSIGSDYIKDFGYKTDSLWSVLLLPG